MGVILSKFRKKKTTIEVLEDLDKKIKEIEQYGQHTEQRHKRIVGTLILYSVALYTITAVVFYFYFFPASLYDQLFYIIPLLIFPLLILFTKKMVSLYYKRKISRNQEKLESMQEQKKQILEDVTETETYKKAKEILMKFAPDQLRSPLSPQPTRTPFASPIPTSSNAPQLSDTPRRAPTPTAPSLGVSDGSVLRRRAIAASVNAQNTQLGKSINAPGVASLVPLSGTATPPMSPYPTGIRQFASPINKAHNPLPRPILPQQRSYIDRLVEYLVGDGPSNRYALICRQCESHNGMALKEEFEYFAFRCCYCNFWNPARKQKPSAPKLELDNTNVNQKTPQPMDDLQSTKTADTDLPSSKSDNSINLSESERVPDSDIEVVEKPNENEEENDERPSEKLESEKEVKKTEESVKESEDKEEEKMEIDDSLSK